MIDRNDELEPLATQLWKNKLHDMGVEYQKAHGSHRVFNPEKGEKDMLLFGIRLGLSHARDGVLADETMLDYFKRYIKEGMPSRRSMIALEFMDKYSHEMLLAHRKEA